MSWVVALNAFWNRAIGFLSHKASVSKITNWSLAWNWNVVNYPKLLLFVALSDVSRFVKRIKFISQ
jgi:hypothetical protein